MCAKAHGRPIYLHKVLRSFFFFQETAIKSQGEDLNVNEHFTNALLKFKSRHNHYEHRVCLCFSKLIFAF